MGAEASRIRFQASRCADLPSQRAALEAVLGSATGVELSPGWFRAEANHGTPWIFQVSANDRPSDIAAGVLFRGRIKRGLHVVLPAKPVHRDFLFAKLDRFARARLVSRMAIESMGIEESVIPDREGELKRIRETNFVIDLASGDPLPSFSKNHRRNVRKAEQNGVAVISLPATPAVETHLALVQASLDRRTDRGETVILTSREQATRDLVARGAAALWQVGVEGRVLSSYLISRIGDAGFYLSGGTSPEGMQIGSSQFLMYTVIRELAETGCKTLCLGYPNEPALARFKAGFGSRPVPVERVEALLRLPGEAAVQRIRSWRNPPQPAPAAARPSIERR